jgi:hypothetical protein
MAGDHIVVREGVRVIREGLRMVVVHHDSIEVVGDADNA